MNRHYSPALETICSSELPGEIGTLVCFESEASLAMYLGMTVLDISSGTATRLSANPSVQL